MKKPKSKLTHEELVKLFGDLFLIVENHEKMLLAWTPLKQELLKMIDILRRHTKRIAMFEKFFDEIERVKKEVEKEFEERR